MENPGFTCRNLEPKKFVAYVKKSVANIENREDHEAFCWIIDLAKEQGSIDYETWKSLNDLAWAQAIATYKRS